jgi:class 3 adenylate cyclase/tetratricopeptide (TPR) repeat protein
VEGAPRICPTCGAGNASAARFCSNCGTRFAAEPAVREVERKVITALFCDVVGSTELAERLDPEDIDRLLQAYHALARARIEAHGGVVEKFIGDAVVGIFGAPAAHEDDPARAVRAALRIIRDLAATGLDLHVRIGVHTGEALVRVGLDRLPEEGFATGDCLNTAARLQGVAEVDGVAVGDPTYRLTMREFDWDDLGPISLKGKAQPLRTWRPQVIDAGARAEAPARRESTPFVGRDAEIERLERAFEEAAAGRTELVTVVAEPGMGKSRLVRELRRRIDAAHPGVVWRTGRSLPYGDGVAFWALGEIAKAHAGILETDDQPTIRAKLERSIGEQDPAQREWLRDRIAPIVGLRTEAEPPPREESFAAWRELIRSLAADGPAVVVFEDLHWADEAFVAFLTSLVDEAPKVPLLVVVTARPTIAERHPGWLERARAGTVFQLASLDDAVVTTLIRSTLSGASPELVHVVLERAAGSPLYAEQLAALVRERGLSAADATLDETVIPPTIQALLAARIDALPREIRPALLDASVIGRVFWSGAVASLEDRERTTVDPVLTDLGRRELIRPHEPSTMAEESEHAFWHALLRDVAYSFLPRSARLAKHRAAAAWITAKAGGELGDLGEIVADHLRRAADLAEATGAADDLPGIRSELAGALLAAGMHALRVEPQRALSHLQAAIELLETDDPRRARALETLGRAQYASAEYVEAAATISAAQDWHRAHGDELTAAGLAPILTGVLMQLGDADGARKNNDWARPILEANPGPGLLELSALDASIPGLDPPIAIERADRAIAMAERLGLAPPVGAVAQRGIARIELGDRAGEADIRRAVDLARATGDLRRAAGLLGVLGNVLMDVATPEEALAAFDEALALCVRHGLAEGQVRASRLDALEMGGRYDDVIAEAPALRDWALAHNSAYAAFMADMTYVAVQFARGELTAPIDDMLARARSVGLPPSAGGGYVAATALALGDADGARRVIEGVLASTPEGSSVFMAAYFVTTALDMGDLDLAERVLARAVPPAVNGRGCLSMVAAALIDEAKGNIEAAHAGFAATAPFFGARGWRYHEAQALTGLGRCRLRMGEQAGATAAFNEARSIAESMKARELLDRIDHAEAQAG